MAFDGIVTKSIVSELNNFIIGSKINKIFQPNKTDIILGLYGNGLNYALYISSNGNNSRLHLTTHSKPNPITAPNFCMLLRKHLLGSKIISINTVDLERVIEINFECLNEFNDKVIKKLFVEILGSYSNIILTTSSNQIIDSIKHFSNPREIMPARFYTFPPTSKHSFLNLSSFNEFIDALTPIPLDNIDKKISDSFNGLSRPFLQYSLKQNNYNLEYTYKYIKDILSKIDTNNISCINTVNDYVVGLNNKNDLDINFFVDDFYYEKEIKDDFISFRNNLLKLILTQLKKCTKKLENINNKLQDCKQMDTYKLYGELITSNLYRLKENISLVMLENYYDNNNLIKIPMDETISPNKNAERYFKKYNKLKNTLEIVSLQKKQTEEELNYIESIIYSIENATIISDLEDIFDEINQNFNTIKTSNHKKAKGNDEKYKFLEFNIDGFTVLVGKSNKQNDELTLKIASKNDIWFHTQKIHGSHVILRTENKQVDNSTLVKCAKLAAKHSKAKLSNNIPVDYTLVKYVKKPTGSKPGMVIYTNYKTLFVNTI